MGDGGRGILTGEFAAEVPGAGGRMKPALLDIVVLSEKLIMPDIGRENRPENNLPAPVVGVKLGGPFLLADSVTPVFFRAADAGTPGVSL